MNLDITQIFEKAIGDIIENNNVYDLVRYEKNINGMLDVVLNDKPECPIPNLLKASLLAIKERYHEALPCALRATGHATNKESADTLGLIFYETEHYKEALPYLRLSHNKYTNDEAMKMRLCYALHCMGHKEESLQIFKELVIAIEELVELGFYKEIEDIMGAHLNEPLAGPQSLELDK